ncbi:MULTISPECIES: ATP-binding protein [unclassified Streptomyces]|uniref:ATP-binding protein n=1 Tax=unclassified Streptomyces TaxID=2593676 RepID=UPI003821BEAB
MDARRARSHACLVSELEAHAHWFTEPDPSSGAHCLTLTLLADHGNAARVARDQAAEFLRGMGAGGVVDDARLIVSELVGNVVNHVVPERSLARPGGSRRVDVHVKAWPKWLFIGVADEDASPPLLPLGDTFWPALREERAEAVVPESGRGLLIVQRVAAAVWWTPEDRGGKTVWCRLDLGSETQGPPS